MPASAAMRVLFLSHRLPFPPNKGEKIRAHWELRQLLDAGHDVDLFCFYSGEEDASGLPEARACCSGLYAEPLDRHRAAARALLAVLRGRAFSIPYFHSKPMAARVHHALSSRRYDLIFVYCSSMAPYVMDWTAVPRILDLVDVDSDKWAQYAEYGSPPGSWLWRRESARLAEFEKQAVSAFEASWVCTAAEAQVLRRIVDSPRIEVLENFLDTDYFNPEHVSIPAKIQALQPYVLFAGSMDYFPNVDAVTHFYRMIFPLIRLRIPQSRFVIAGRSPARAVRQLARDPAVHVTGALPDLRPYLKGASVAVAPMRIARGVQNKILEAMAMDLPVVASSKAVSALPKELAALVVREDEPRRFAQAVQAILEATMDGSANGKRSAVAAYFREAQRAEQFNRLIAELAPKSGNLPSDFRERESVEDDAVAGGARRTENALGFSRVAGDKEVTLRDVRGQG